MLSPDWTYSTIQQALAPTGIGRVHEETKKLRQKIATMFWIKAAIYFGAGINLLNTAMRKMDETKHPEYYKHREDMDWTDYTLMGNAIGHKTHLFAGRFSDGTERYIRWGKQFREFPEMLFDATGFNPITASLKKMGGKGNTLLQLASQIATGHSLSMFKNRDIADTEGWEKVWGITKTIFTAPFPFSTRTMFDKNKDFFITDIAMPSSKGMTRGKAIRYFKYAYERKDADFFKAVYSDALDNNLPAPILADAALSTLKAENTRDVKSHIRTIEDIDEALKTATLKEKKVLYNQKKRMIKEKVMLEHGGALLDLHIQKLEAEGIFEERE